MSNYRYRLAFLSTNKDLYQLIDGLLQHSAVCRFELTWIDWAISPSWEQLPFYDAYLSDAPLLELLKHHEFITQQSCFWLAATPELCQEILHQGVTDCFLIAELNSSLLEHCLRIALRQKQPSGIKYSALTEFEGDRFQTLIRNVPGAVYRCLHSEQWEGMYISDGIWNIVGYAARDFSAGGDRTFESIIHPVDREFVDRVVGIKLQEKQPFALEYRLIHQDGTVKWVDERGQGVFDPDDNLLWIDGVIVDISDKKAIAQELAQQAILNALQESETRFRELVENIEESFWINPPDPTEVLYVSPAYEKIWGRSCQSLIDHGGTWIEAVHPDDRDRQIAALTEMRAGGIFNEKYRIVRPDGTVRWIHARSSQIRDDHGELLRHVGVVTDITDLKEIELELRLSESRFRSMFDQAALGIAQIEMDSRFHVVNQAFCDLLGYTQAELREMTWQQLTHPDDVQKCRPGFERILSRTANSFSLEKRYIHKDGHVIWIKAITSFIYDTNDQPQYLLALVEDITSQKETAIALAESQNRYRELVEGIPAIVYQFSTKRSGLFYSSHLRNILGYDTEYLLQNPTLWHDSIHSEDRSKVDNTLEKIQLGENFELEYQIRDAAGNWRWFYDCSFNIEQFDNEMIIDGFALDITERKDFDIVLQHRLNLETVLANISHLMIVESDLDLTEVLALLGQTFQADRMSVMVCQENTSVVERLAAWVKTTELQLEMTEIDLSIYPWWLQQWEAQRPILINRHAPCFELSPLEQDFLNQLQVQAVMWMPIRDHLGNPWGCIECSSTQTDHMIWSKEDAELMAIAGDLIYNYGDRQTARKQLELAKEAAEIANHAKNQFLTNMSHELRTPLNAILGFTQIMEQSKILPEIHREHLAIVHRSGRYLLTLLNDILNLAKVEKGTLSLNKALFNLHELLHDLEHMYEVEMQRKNLQFFVRWDETIPRYITADQAKLHSVLIHLLSNALKFTESGSVTLLAQAIAHDPLRIRFCVIDTGIGIKELEQQKLFHNFVKLEAGDRLGKGSGLGLALSQKLVALMGSEITLSSDFGVGSCFAFELTCEDVRQALTASLQYPQSTRQPITLTAADLQTLPTTWREKFHNAALSARAKQLEALIAELPSEAEAIAYNLKIILKKLEFDQLANLSQPTPSD